MITPADSFSTVDLGNYYAILSERELTLKAYREIGIDAAFIQAGFGYDSGSNEQFLSVHELRSLMKQHIEQDFIPV